MSALENAQLLPQCQVLGEEPSTGTKAAQDQTQPEAEHGPCSYQIGACGRTDNLLISWTDRILANHRLTLTGLLTSLRFCFAFFGLGERYRDISPTTVMNDLSFSP
jgi:hypothetical protein